MCVCISDVKDMGFWHWSPWHNRAPRGSWTKQFREICWIWAGILDSNSDSTCRNCDLEINEPNARWLSDTSFCAIPTRGETTQKCKCCKFLASFWFWMILDDFGIFSNCILAVFLQCHCPGLPTAECWWGGAAAVSPSDLSGQSTANGKT